MTRSAYAIFGAYVLGGVAARDMISTSGSVLISSSHRCQCNVLGSRSALEMEQCCILSPLSRLRGGAVEKVQDPSIIASTACVDTSPSPTRVLLTRLRLLFFASEVGESLRPLLKHWQVQLTYAISWFFCIFDVVLGAIEAQRSGSDAARVVKLVVQNSIFHSIATMLIPALAIHKVVHQVQHLQHVVPKLAATAQSSWRYYLPSLVGIAFIPAMPLFDHPVEQLLEWCVHKLERPAISKAKHS